MAKVYEFLANGFEEIEGLAPVDILRRGGIEVTTVSITGSREVTTSHGVTILADTTFEDAGEMADADLLMLPGGMPGSTNLNAHAGVLSLCAVSSTAESSLRPSARHRWFSEQPEYCKESALPAHRDSRNILPVPSIRASCLPSTAMSSPAKDHAQHCLTPIRFCRFSLAKRKRGHWKRRCNTPI